MWSSATLAMELSSVVMKVAMEITATMLHGLRRPATERAGVQPPPPPPAPASDTSGP